MKGTQKITKPKKFIKIKKIIIQPKKINLDEKENTNIPILFFVFWII